MATPTRVQEFGGNGSTTAAGTATVATGNWLVAVGSTISGTLSIADTLGLTWTPITGGTTNRNAWTAPIPSGGSTTVTLSGGTTRTAISVLEVTGQAASPIDQQVVATGTSGSPNSGATGTAASANELAIGLLSTFSAATADAISGQSFSPSLTAQTDETVHQSGTTACAAVCISDGPIASAGTETYSASDNAAATWTVWCLLIQGPPTSPATPGFFASVGHPGPRVPNNTGTQGGY